MNGFTVGGIAYRAVPRLSGKAVKLKATTQRTDGLTETANTGEKSNEKEQPSQPSAGQTPAKPANL